MLYRSSHPRVAFFIVFRQRFHCIQHILVRQNIIGYVFHGIYCKINISSCLSGIESQALSCFFCQSSGIVVIAHNSQNRGYKKYYYGKAENQFCAKFHGYTSSYSLVYFAAIYRNLSITATNRYTACTAEYLFVFLSCTAY